MKMSTVIMAVFGLFFLLGVGLVTAGGGGGTASTCNDNCCTYACVEAPVECVSSSGWKWEEWCQQAEQLGCEGPYTCYNSSECADGDCSAQGEPHH